MRGQWEGKAPTCSEVSVREERKVLDLEICCLLLEALVGDLWLRWHLGPNPGKDAVP